MKCRYDSEYFFTDTKENISSIQADRLKEIISLLTVNLVEWNIVFVQRKTRSWTLMLKKRMSKTKLETQDKYIKYDIFKLKICIIESFVDHQKVTLEFIQQYMS